MLEQGWSFQGLLGRQRLTHSKVESKGSRQAPQWACISAPHSIKRAGVGVGVGETELGLVVKP